MIELGSAEFWSRLDREPERLAHEICSIDLTNLEQTLQQHSGLRAWLNAVYERMRIDEERAKWELTKTTAYTLLFAKETVDANTGKPKTVQILQAEVDTNPAVQEATTTLHALQQRRGAMRAITEALEDRKDMLIQIAAKHRQEAKDY